MLSSVRSTPADRAKHARLARARDGTLGARGERTTSQVLYERDGLGAPQAKLGRPRCYSLGTSLQISRSSTAPPAAAKIREHNMTAAHKAQFELVQASVTIICGEMMLTRGVSQAVCDFTVGTLKEQGPLAEQTIQRQYRDLANIPSVGVDDNFSFDSLQLNLAPAVSGSNSTSVQLGPDISH